MRKWILGTALIAGAAWAQVPRDVGGVEGAGAPPTREGELPGRGIGAPRSIPAPRRDPGGPQETTPSCDSCITLNAVSKADATFVLGRATQVENSVKIATLSSGWTITAITPTLVEGATAQQMSTPTCTLSVGATCGWTYAVPATKTFTTGARAKYTFGLLNPLGQKYVSVKELPLQ